MENLRYPIGRLVLERDASAQQVEEWIRDISETPARLCSAVEGLTDAQLDTPYRPEGWTVRQVIHHMPDSHMNSYIRFKLALTEEKPVIKGYHEDQWARLEDTSRTPIEVSLRLLDSLHERWGILLRSLNPADLGRVFVHPDMGEIALSSAIGMYAWHGKHHVAHITELRNRMGW